MLLNAELYAAAIADLRGLLVKLGRVEFRSLGYSQQLRQYRHSHRAALARPAFDELCGCVGIFLSPSQQGHWDRLDPQGRVEFMRRVYSGGADYSIDASCEICQGVGLRPIAKAA